MPRPTRSYGRPGTEVIPPGWAASHRPVLAKTHTAACSIRHEGGTSTPLNPTTGKRTVTPNAAHYTGPCAVAFDRQPTAPVGGDETIPTIDTIRVRLNADAAPATVTGDLVTITAAPDGDTSLAGRTLLVEAIERDSVAWERILICSDNQS